MENFHKLVVENLIKKNYSKMWKENLKLSDFIHTAGDKLKHVSLNRNMKSFFQ